MSDAGLAYNYDDLWFMKLRGREDKLPLKKWGGYGQDFHDADEVYSHAELMADEHDHWGVCGAKDPDHARVSTLIFDLDVHKAPDGFDFESLTVPEDTALVKSQNGGFHVPFLVHADRGEFKEADFEITRDLGWDIDIRGSVVKHHVVAPGDIPGVDSPYEIVRDDDILTVFDPADAAERIQFEGEPLLEFSPDRGASGDYSVDRDAEPPEEMPTCYHRGLQLRAANPDEHPSTHKVNTLTALCGLAAGYDVGTMVGHFCDEFAPGPNGNVEKTKYHLRHMAQKMDRDSLAPPSISTLREWGILDDNETCDCEIDYHDQSGGTSFESAAEKFIEQMENQNDEDDTDIEAAADGGAVAARSGDSGPSINHPSIEEQIRDKAVRPFAEDEIDQDWLIHRTAEVLDDELAWIHPRSDTRGWRTTLYNYVPQEGIYEPHGEAEAERIAERALGPVASNHRINELTSKLARMNRTRAKRLDEAPNRLVVDNGILDLTTGELSAYSSSEFHRARVDVEYEPEADCPKIDEFLHDVVETEADVETLYRFIAHALYKGYPDSKALMCLGEGSNGKTVFLELVEEFIGEFNTTNKSLQELSTNDFAAQKLSGKMANIEADMGDQDVKSLSMFKKLSGNGDTVDANVKFEESIEFNNHATLMFAANKMPILNDDTRGNWRRWVPMRFPNTFDAEDPDAKDPVDKAELKERLHADEEMRGLLAKCVEEIKRWHSDPSEPWFPNTPGWEDVRREMLAASNPVYEFATECLIKGEPDDEDISVPKAHVRKAYDRFAKERGLERLRPEEFGERLLNLRDFHVSASREGAAKLQVYSGVDLNKLGERFADLLDEEVKESSEDGQNKNLEEAAEDDPVGGRQKYEQIKDYVAREEKKNDGAVPRGAIVAKLTQWIGVAPDNAKQVIVEARKRGYIMEDGEDQYRAT